MKVKAVLNKLGYDVLFSDEESWDLKVPEGSWDLKVKNIMKSSRILVLLTPNALKSLEIEREIHHAQMLNKIIIPFLNEKLNYAEIKWGLESIQGIQFSDEVDLSRELYSMIRLSVADNAELRV